MTQEKIRVCPHCNNQMRRWKNGDFLPDFAEVSPGGQPLRKWWVCPGTPSAFTQTFYDENAEPTKFLGRWRDKKWVWHNVLDVDLSADNRKFEPAFFSTEDEAREKVHGWADVHLDKVDLVAIEKAFQ